MISPSAFDQEHKRRISANWAWASNFPAIFNSTTTYVKHWHCRSVTNKRLTSINNTNKSQDNGLRPVNDDCRATKHRRMILFSCPHTPFFRRWRYEESLLGEFPLIWFEFTVGSNSFIAMSSFGWHGEDIRDVKLEGLLHVAPQASSVGGGPSPC